VLLGPAGERRVKVAQLATAAFATDIGDDEILREVAVPRVSKDARWGYYKFCRKTGDFAEAIGAVLHDPERATLRLVIGATNGAPIVSISLCRGGFPRHSIWRPSAARSTIMALPTIRTARRCTSSPPRRALAEARRQ